MSDPAPTMTGPIEYDLNADDLTAFIANYSNSSLTIARLGWASYVAMLFILSAFAYPAYLLTVANRPLAVKLEILLRIWPLLLVLGLAVSFLALLPWINRRIQPRLVRRMIQEGKSKGAYGPHQLSWDSTGLREQSRRGETMRKWHCVERIVHGPEHILIYTGVEGFVVPLRAFRSPAEADAFLAEIASHIQAEPTGPV